MDRDNHTKRRIAEEGGNRRVRGRERKRREKATTEWKETSVKNDHYCPFAITRMSGMRAQLPESNRRKLGVISDLRALWIK